MTDQIAVTSEMQERFAQWFRENYPGPNTVIHDPDWHAPKIFRAALLSVHRYAGGGPEAFLTPDYDHELKALPAYFHPLADGEKRFEVRRDDRGFQKGDVIRVREFVPGARSPREQYTGNETFVRVDWILTGGQLGIEPGFVVMSVSLLGDGE